MEIGCFQLKIDLKFELDIVKIVPKSFREELLFYSKNEILIHLENPPALQVVMF